MLLTYSRTVHPGENNRKMPPAYILSRVQIHARDTNLKLAGRGLLNQQSSVFQLHIRSEKDSPKTPVFQQSMRSHSASLGVNCGQK